jgi:hypothetical protein
MQRSITARKHRELSSSIHDHREVKRAFEPNFLLPFLIPHLLREAPNHYSDKEKIPATTYQGPYRELGEDFERTRKALLEFESFVNPSIHGTSNGQDEKLANGDLKLFVKEGDVDEVCDIVILLV